ncbi:hypothetical protein STVIR_0638 [Streptomyces viridochromogenes Tue57]|uniref:Uncharacterized protein n=1 Tax=Streptomyces viridochromogenes Tue57 TaxID=1160705 RepID=L8PLJ0_STRVR|nr:hypothetical protein STVIR_0638 [Streptomyces viridochromogenes Tue57]
MSNGFRSAHPGRRLFPVPFRRGSPGRVRRVEPVRSQGSRWRGSHRGAEGGGPTPRGLCASEGHGRRKDRFIEPVR